LKGFISYSRDDSLLVAPLVHDLDKLGHDVWMDKELYGGQDWWDEILRHIAACDFFVLALSPRSLASGPCRLELAYADSLRRPFLPVAVAPVDTNVFPPQIAHAQYVDYSTGDKEALLGLAGTVVRLPSAPDLPDPMPTPPPMPVAPLYDVEQRIHSEHLSREEQVVLLFDLQQRALKPELTAGVINLLVAFRSRDFVFGDIRDRIDAEIHRLRSLEGPAPTAAPYEPTAAPYKPPPPPPPPLPRPPAVSAAPPAKAKAKSKSKTKTKARYSAGFMTWIIIAGVFAGIVPFFVGIASLGQPARRGQAKALIVVGIVWAGLALIGSLTPSSGSGP